MVDLERVVRGQPGRERGGEHEEREKCEADDRQAVATEPAPRLAVQRRPAGWMAFDDGRRRGAGSGG